MKDCYGGSRESKDKARVDRVMGYKSGGAVKDDAGTRISITIGAQPNQTPDKAAAAGALMSAMAQANKPPTPPPAPPPVGGPMGAGPAGGPPGLGPRPLGMKRGGAVKQTGGDNGIGRLQKARNQRAAD